VQFSKRLLIDSIVRSLKECQPSHLAVICGIRIVFSHLEDVSLALEQKATHLTEVCGIF
jgi:hypothetical protein